MSISIQDMQGIKIVELAGRLDTSQSDTLDRELRQLIDDGARHVILDMGELKLIGSTGIGVLISWTQELRQKGGDVVLCSVPWVVERILRIPKLDSIIEFHPDRPTALSFMRRKISSKSG